MKQNEFQYRQGSIDDKEQLMRLALASYGQFAEVLGPVHWATMKASLSNEERATALFVKATTFVCTDKDEIIGMAHLLPSGNPTDVFDKDWSVIRWVGVHPDYAGHGIAKTLTKMCVDHAIATNEQTVALHTSEFMNAARHIYESIGFVVLKEIPPIFGKRYWLYTLDLIRN